MNNTVEILTNFISAAEHSRKYNSNSASGFRSALKLFEAELHEEEKESVDKFAQNLQAIYAAVVSKNQTKYTAASLDVYKRRIQKVISDYEKYGKDPTKMSSWEVKTVIRKKRGSSQVSNEVEEKTQIVPSGKPEYETFSPGLEATVYPVPIRNQVVHVRVPNELAPLTINDINKIKNVLSILFDIEE